AVREPDVVPRTHVSRTADVEPGAGTEDHASGVQQKEVRAGHRGLGVDRSEDVRHLAAGHPSYDVRNAGACRVGETRRVGRPYAEEAEAVEEICARARSTCDRDGRPGLVDNGA